MNCLGSDEVPSFNGKPKATAFPGIAVAFGLPLNDLCAGCANPDRLQRKG
jgi:hypothetical protein